MLVLDTGFFFDKSSVDPLGVPLSDPKGDGVAATGLVQFEKKSSVLSFDETLVSDASAKSSKVTISGCLIASALAFALIFLYICWQLGMSTWQ